MGHEHVDMTIERLIYIPARGTIVVGTIVAGSISPGDVVEFRGVVARCAAIERYRELLEVADAGEHVGVLLEGVLPSDLMVAQPDSV